MSLTSMSLRRPTAGAAVPAAVPVSGNDRSTVRNSSSSNATTVPSEAARVSHARAAATPPPEREYGQNADMVRDSLMNVKNNNDAAVAPVPRFRHANCTAKSAIAAAPSSIEATHTARPCVSAATAPSAMAIWNNATEFANPWW